MSIALLLEKYDVFTEEGLQNALAEIEKEEEEVDEALSNALSKACTLEGRLRMASQAYTKLEAVREDAETAAGMVDRTAALARDVSAKVRQLDLARSRVAECQQRVHDLIDLRVCSAGVEAAIKAHDYEAGAAHVARFLSMAPGSVAAAQARGAPDPRHDMAQAARTLRDHLVKKLGEAARRGDDADVERLFRLFPQIGCAPEGVDLLADYLATKAEAAVRAAAVVSGDAAAGAVYADALTRALEAGAAVVERARVLVSAAPGHLARAVAVIQPHICAGAARVCAQLVAARRAVAGERAAPRAVEPGLDELAAACARLHLYTAFLRRRAQMDAAALPEAERARCAEAMERLIAESGVTRTAQDVLCHYLELERYFLEESVSKALKLSAQASAGAGAASSLVDDVFYIARKVIRRGMSTGSADGGCAALNECGAQLERAAGALRRRLAAPPHAPLAFPAPPRARQHDALALGKEALNAKALYLTHINEAESGAEWAERLASEACAAAETFCRGSELGKVRSCAAQLASAAEAFRDARELALQALRAALQPRAAEWAAVLADPDTDMEEVDEEANAMVAALDALGEEARSQLPRAADALLAAVLADLTARAHRDILRNTYTREGGLSVERRARRLAAWAGGGAGGARERCARLTQAAALLALETPAHARDALLPAPRLAPHDAREILARRSDFKMEDIKRLKL